MSEDTRVYTSDLTIDSTLLGWDLCETEDEWVLGANTQDGYICLTTEGDIVDVPEGEPIPEEAVFDSIIKAQSTAQANENKAPKSREETESIEEKSEVTNDIEKSSGNTTEKDSSITDNDTSETDSETESQDSSDDNSESYEVEDSPDEEQSNSEPVTDGNDEDLRNSSSEVEDAQTEDSMGVFGDGAEIEEDSESVKKSSDGNLQNNSDSETDEDSVFEMLSSVFSRDNDSSDEAINEEPDSEQSDSKNDEDIVENSGIISRLSSKIRGTSSDDTTEYESDSVETEQTEDVEAHQENEQEDDASENDGFLNGLFQSDEEESTDVDEDGLFTDWFGSDGEVEDKTVDSDSEDISAKEWVLSALSTDIADIDQERPDAQNVSIDYVDLAFNRETSDFDFKWGDPIQKFWGKLEDVRNGDETARRDIYGDLWARYSALVKRNSYARGDALDAVFTLCLTLMGLAIVFVGLVNLVLLFLPYEFANVVGNLSVLTETSSYGDHMMLTTVALAIASVWFWLSRRAASQTVVSAIKFPARGVAGFILFAQVSVISYVLFAIVLGGGQDALHSLELAIDSIVEGAFSYFPEGFSEQALLYYESYRGPDSTVFGMSIMQASFFMALVGGVTAYPVVKRAIARFILTANMSPREFREETGILIEDIAGDDEESEPTPEELEYDMGDGSGEDIDASAGLDADVDMEDIDGADFGDQQLEETEELLALPDHIRGSPFEDYTEVRRYWVRAPYAYVSIVHNPAQNDYRYVVVEPELDEAERVVFDELKERLDTVLLFEDVEEKEDHEEEQRLKLEKLESRMIELSQEYDIDINDETFHRLMYYVERDYVYYNKIDPLINDPNIEDISCDGEGKYIFVFHADYKDIITNVKFERDELRSFIQELAQRSGEHISAADPQVDASLPDGSRAQMTLGTSVTTHGSTFTIRLFEEIPFTPVDLLDYNTFSLDQMAYLWTAIEHNKSLIFAGGTASGKTTSMNAVSLFIPPKSKVITIEDTREISLPQENWIPATTREGLGDEGEDEIDMYELLRAALRQRPEYLVVGEIRGSEAETLFQAMNTGHTTYSTMHAETVDAAVGRLTNPPINVPKQMITALDIICIQNQIRFTDEDGNAKNVRRNEETREIVKLRDSGQFDNRRPFQWDPETDNFIKSLEDSHVLARISEENGWDRDEREEQLLQRREVLEYMLENDIREFEDVANVIQSYMVDSERIIKRVRNDTLEPSELSSLTDLEWKTGADPDKTLNSITSDELSDGESPTSGD